MAADLIRLGSTNVRQDFVFNKCNYFVDVQLWPFGTKLNPSSWLENFSDNDRSFAIQLLNNFLFFPDVLMDEMLKSAFMGIRNHLCSSNDPLASIQTIWKSFMHSALITTVTGETPNISDSGFTFARKARQILGICEPNLLENVEVLKRLANGPPLPVVFVDDFVGSGNQFKETWERQHTLGSLNNVSFHSLNSLRRGLQFFYCPILCTQYGKTELIRECPEVKVCAAHILPDCYSAVSNDSILWPPTMLSSGIEFLRRVSSSAGIPDTDGGDYDWRGFHKLGLTIAFSHSIPDATLPIFYWEENGWKPLIRRT